MAFRDQIQDKSDELNRSSFYQRLVQPVANFCARIAMPLVQAVADLILRKK